jgi:DNA polymerase-4
MKRILHIDMDAFFAAIEELRRPQLKGKPVVVGGSGDPSKRGVVSTANYEARKYGIHSALPLRTAYKLCPHAVFVPLDFHIYIRASKRIKEILREFSPRCESAGLDEAYLDISELEGTSESIARTIQEKILAETRLTCSVGIGPTKLLAKIASDMKKPAGVTIIRMEDIPTQIWPLEVRKLIGVGPKTQERLASMGVKTIGDLAALPLETLTRHFGESHAEYLKRGAEGLRDSPVVESHEVKSISRETTFQQDTTDREKLTDVLRRLTEPVVKDLQRHGHQARTITLKLRYADFQTLSRQTTLEQPSDSLEDIWPAVLACFERFGLDKPVRLIGVGVKGFDSPEEPSPGTVQEELGLWDS